MIHFDAGLAGSEIQTTLQNSLEARATRAHEQLLSGCGPGNEWLGWQTILSNPNDALLEDISHYADSVREHADVFLCVGIGGSYLGSKAVIDALSPYFKSGTKAGNIPEILFAGHHLSGSYLEDLLAYLEGKSVYVNLISKSGTTLEPAIAGRVIRQWVEDHFENADERVSVTTSASKGALLDLALEKGYRRYVIPDDVGGRFSVLTPVGLIPIAVAGFDIRSLFYGAVAMHGALTASAENQAVSYAVHRIGLLQSGFTTEILAHFEPRLGALGAWWQQLFGESEGKNETGLFPAVVQYTTDLHSLGQFVQEGARSVFETFLTVASESGFRIPAVSGDFDGLNYLTGQTVDAVNKTAFMGTYRAHTAGGVPVMKIALDTVGEEDLGRLIYFFQHATAIGGYLLDLNPFDQPGVEAYKKEMLQTLKERASRG